MKSHWPQLIDANLLKWKPPIQPLFLQPKSHVKFKDHIWYLKTTIGKNMLAKTVKTLIEACDNIVGNERHFSNKTPRRMGISRMEASHIPVEKGMKITGHRDHKSYGRYNAVPRDIDQKVCQDVISNTNALAKGKPLTYIEILDDEQT